MNQLNQFFQSHPNIQTLIYVLGILSISKTSFNLLSFVLKRFRPRKNIPSRYGQGSWVLITGASDGIGKEMAIKFSNLGFKIILAARNKQKLESVQSQIKTESQIVIADFSNSNKPGFFERIIEQIEDKEISILINNVGVDLLQHFHKMTEQEIQEMIAINIVPTTLLSRYLIPKFMVRKNKCAIVNVTSLAGVYPTPYFSVYCGTKAYGNFLTSCLASEYPNIDILSFRPSEVSTNMTANKPEDIMTISTSACVEGLFNELGYTSSTYGHWKHEVQGALYKRVPKCIYDFVFMRFLAPVWMKEREDAKKKVQ